MNLLFENIGHLLFEWQTLVGAFLGAAAPFTLWWFTEWYKKQEARQKRLGIIERALVDQINSLSDVKKTIQRFIEEQLDVLIARVPQYPHGVVVWDNTFMPLFAVRSIPADMTAGSGSVYIDNKLMKAVALSHDLPHIIEDIRRQLDYTFQMNEKMIAHGAHADNQRAQYINNLTHWREIVTRDILETNFRIYFKVLVEALATVDHRCKIGKHDWDRAYVHKKFFFFQPKELPFEQMEKCFVDVFSAKRSDVEKQLNQEQ